MEKLKLFILGILVTVLGFGQVQNSEMAKGLSSFYPLGTSYFKSGATQTSGTVTTGKYYTIGLFVAGDDFTNIGASSNASGVTFLASGTTPTTWTNSSVVAEAYYQIGDVAGGAHGTNNGAFPALGENDPAAFNYYEFDGASGNGLISDNAKIQNIFDDGGYAGAWVYARSDGENNNARIMDKSQWLIAVNNEAGGLLKVTFTHNFSITNGNWRTTDAIIPINTWIHVALSYNNSAVANNPTLTLTTLAGVATEYTVGSGITEIDAPDLTRTTDVGSDLYIGNRATDNVTFDGYIRGVQLFNYIPSSGDQTFYSDILNHLKFADIGAGATATSGTLTIGKTYRLTDWITNDDFTNVGAASNADGVEFVATGTTPTTWTNSSVVTTIGNVLNLDPAGMEYETNVWHDFYNTLECTMTSATHYGKGDNGRNVWPKAMYFDGTAYIDIDDALTPLASTTTGTWGMKVCPATVTPSTIMQLLSFSDASVIERIILYISSAGMLKYKYVGQYGGSV